MSALARASGVYLQTYLAPLAPVLLRPDVTDIFVNRPGEVWVETVGGEIERQLTPELDEASLWRLAKQIAAAGHQGVSREHPLLATTLPDGARVQIVAPPATRGDLALAIRKHVVSDLTLEDYSRAGALDSVEQDGGNLEAAVDSALRALLDERRIVEFLRMAVQERKTIVISGGTSSGKTTFLNSLLKEVPRRERLVLIEDTPEVQIDHANAVGLVAVRGEQGETRVGAKDLLQASLRMRPDRIILGELRGAEAFSFLKAVSTGHPGSITTIHADSPRRAVDQLALLVVESGANLGRGEVVDYVNSVVDVFIQVVRRDGRRRVSEIALRRAGPR